KEHEIGAGRNELRFATRATGRVMQSADLGRSGIGRLVNVVKTSKVYPVSTQVADVQDGIHKRLKLHRQTVLDAVRLLMIFREPHARGGSKEAGRQRVGRIWVVAGNESIEGVRHEASCCVPGPRAAASVIDE